MHMNTYLAFNGDCRAAFTFYAQLLGGKVTAMMRFGDAPGCDAMPAEAKDLIMHGCVDIGGHMLMGTDATPGHPYAGITGAHVVLHVDDPSKADWLFAALAEKGRIDMPIQETFWARRYGIAVDRFGVPWMVNCPPLDKTP